MGIVYNIKVGGGFINQPHRQKADHRKEYINAQSCRQKTSRRRASKALTRQNIQFLKSIGLNVVKNLYKRKK